MPSSLLSGPGETVDLTARQARPHFPIVPVRAHGMTVEGADGRHYLDCLAGAGTLALGHNHPVVLDATRRISDAVEDEFTTALFDVLPPGFARDARVHFCGPAGTDAVEAAVELTQTSTGRTGLLVFAGAYHGMTAEAPDVIRLPFPYPYRCPFGVGGDQGTEIGVRYTESLLDNPSNGVPTPAAMIVEAIQGEGGVIPAPDDWLREMRRITAERGIPLIADEVQTGVGRTGTFWAVEHSGVIPDVMVLSKAVGGSMPLAVIVYRGDLDARAPSSHTDSNTFQADRPAMAAGAATLRYVAEADLSRRAANLGARMMEELRGIAADRPCIGEVRGRGLMLGLEIVEPDAGPDALGARPAAPVLAALARVACLGRGLIVELGGRSDTVLRLLPPLIMTDAEADAVLERLAAALADAEAAYREGK